jgi:hypothetical protein
MIEAVFVNENKFNSMVVSYMKQQAPGRARKQRLARILREGELRGKCGKNMVKGNGVACCLTKLLLVLSVSCGHFYRIPSREGVR